MGEQERYGDRALELLKRLCAQPSVSAQGHDSAEMRAAADLVEAELRTAGFSTQRLAISSAPPIIYGELRGSGPGTVLLYNHYDVQPPEPLELWESPPFVPTERAGNLYARGTSDNKGELAARLSAIHALRDELGVLPLTLRWVIEGEEEIGSPNFGAIIKPHVDLLRADACLWEGSGFDAEDRPKISLGAKGMLYVQFEVQRMDRDAHSGNATVLPSAAWRLVQALASIRSPEGRVLIPGFYDAVVPPTAQERAVLADTKPELQALSLQQYGLTDYVDSLTGEALEERKAFSPTCNIAGISSGYAGLGLKTVLPARAMAKMDFRLVPNQDPKVIARSLRAHLDFGGFSDVTFTVLGSCVPVTTPLSHPLARRIAAIAESFEGRPPAISLISGGSLPLLEPLQQLVGVSGLAAPGNATYWANGMHAPNEHVRIRDLYAAVRFNIHMLRSLGESLS